MELDFGEADPAGSLLDFGGLVALLFWCTCARSTHFPFMARLRRTFPAGWNGGQTLGELLEVMRRRRTRTASDAPQVRWI